MKKSGFFNSAQGTTDRSYQAIDFALPLGALAGGKGGIMMGIGDSFKFDWVLDGEFTLGTGFAFCGEMPGWWYYSDEELTITLHDAQTPSTPCFIRSAEAGQDRVNILAIEMDGETDREVSLVVLPGTLDQGAYIEPVIDNTDGYDTYYVPIAKVVLNTTKIISVTDIRETTVGNNCLSVPKDESDDPLVKVGYCGLQQIEDEDLDEDLIADIYKGTWKESYYGVGISDGERLITQGLCNIEDSTEFPDGLEWPVTYYVQENGKIDTSPTKKIAGYSISESMFLVNLQGPFGQNEKYEENMVDFTAIPGPTTKVRFSIHLPADALGVKLKYKSTPWIDTDTVEESGILIADLDTDAGYYGDNNWYETTIDADETENPELVSDGTLIYVKAFPYASSVNEEHVADDPNEKAVTVGTLKHEWTADDITGMWIDSIGGNHLNMTNVSKVTGRVGSAMEGSDGNAELGTSDLNIGASTVTFIVWPTSTDTGLLGHATRGHIYATIEEDTLTFGANARESEYTVYPGSGYYHIAITIQGDTLTLFVDGVEQGSTTVASNDLKTIDYIGKANVGATGDTHYEFNCKIDQFRIFDGILTTGDIKNIYNGGEGC